MMNHWQRHVGATLAGLIYCIEPVFASAFALFLPGWFSEWAGVRYPNETVTLNLLLGGGLITLANVLVQWPSVPPAPATESTRVETQPKLERSMVKRAGRKSVSKEPRVSLLT
jgi:hypothetical protein